MTIERELSLQGVRELSQRAFELLFKKLAHEIWRLSEKNFFIQYNVLFLTTALTLAENEAQAARNASWGTAAHSFTSFA